MAESRRELGLRHVVGARAAAAPVGLGERYEHQLRDGREQSARLGADLLAMDEMARVVVRGGRAYRPGRHGQADGREIFARVLHPRREPLAALAPISIVLQQPAVLVAL